MANTTLHPEPGAAKSDFRARMLNFRINGATELADSGWDAVNRRLAEAHAVLCVIGAAVNATDDAEFGNLNSDIQRTAIDAVKQLVAQADFYCDELYYSSRSAAR